MNLSTTVALARHWCGIPSSYIGVYQNTLMNSSIVARHNVSDWVPYGVIALQYRMYPIIAHQAVYSIQVHQRFHINVSIVENELKKMWTDWTQPTYSPRAEVLKILAGKPNIYRV